MVKSLYIRLDILFFGRFKLQVQMNGQVIARPTRKLVT